MNEFISFITLLFTTLYTVIINTLGLICLIITFGRYRFVLIDYNSNPTKMNGLMEFLKKGENRISTSEILTNDGYIPKGIILGKWWCIILFTENVNLYGRYKIEYSAYIFAKKDDIERMIDSKKDDDNNELFEVKTEYVTTYREKGCWLDEGFLEQNTILTRKTIINVNIIRQNEIYNDILSLFYDTPYRRTSVLIYGSTGSGKTHIGKMLAKSLNGVLCDDFDPSLHGVVYPQLIDYVKPSRDKPLIIQIDEFDTIIFKIHNNNTFKLHKFMRSGIYNKKTFNKFMDRLSEYENVIVVLTMNTCISKINDMDNSYLREGRIDKIYKMDNMINTTENNIFIP